MAERSEMHATGQKAFAKTAISEESFRAADALLSRVEFETRTVIVEKALKAAAAPAARRGEELAPDSVATGTRAGWSRKMREKRSGVRQIKATIGASTVRSYRGAMMAIYVGPIHPAGNLINVIGHAHAQMLWGRRGGNVEPNQFMLKAAEQTQAEQQSAFVSAIQTGVDRVLSRK